ncbi:phosphoinositide-3-kinase-interacting protein 1-like [Carassius auratus]|uniref:Phosphoinositide-3-kinase-interacting protein 1-like n=1 Tax=Carassius auratus TaxID=7957 RepID=A0A6P6PEY2_CARAU|nr:phosphoinositide-3-kinase-interacting protein 1-like [Carassius auratus]XP_026119638.1 phosphoinositide-3-kinase-interacting protein 1-like [Carassius auratus]XP_052451311.1 phosphoinositide-3-kinase-interacting protein 1 [Carassius gibelio]
MKMCQLLYFVFLLSSGLVDGLSVVEECITSNGEDYKGMQQKTSTGNICLNWNSLNSQSDVGDHNFCRNPDGSEKPWCYVSGSDGVTRKEACDIMTCQDQNSTEATAPEEYVPTQGLTPRMVVTFENADSFPSQVEGVVVQPVKGVHQQVRSGPKKKKDLGTLGYVLAVFMMAIIILLGGGITIGYFYKRGRDLKKQHEQRVYEREMHRITLPLSAFANPTCELVDENTIIISAEPINQTPTQEPVEGADPLMGTAGTPGA